MAIQSISTTEVVTVEKSTNLKEVAKLMFSEHVGCVIVTEGNGRRIPTGVITDRDIAICVGSSQNPQELLVEQIMHSKPVVAKTSDGIFETIVKMRENGIKRVPVVTDDGSLYGIVSSDDLLSLMGEEINNLSRIPEVQIEKEQGARLPTEKRAEQ